MEMLYQIANEYDYLKLLTLQEPVDEKALQLAYRQLAKQVHPDHFNDAAQRELAERAFCNLNQALNVLKDPEQRSLYLARRQEITPHLTPAEKSSGFALPFDIMGEEGQARVRQLKNSKHASDMVEQAKRLDKQGQLDEAIHKYKEAIRLNPQLAAYHSSLALLMRKKGWEAYAQAEFQKALNLNPEDAVAREHFKPVPVSASNTGVLGKLRQILGPKRPQNA
ncbi:MAG: DnaJ domain-containing protein [Candidatus Sericytochromatia bacterium]